MNVPKLPNVRAALGAKLDALREDLRAKKRLKIGQRSLLDWLAPEWTRTTPTAFVYGNDGREVWTRTLALKDWPTKVESGWLAGLLFPFGDVTIAQHVEPIPKKTAMSRLRAQRTFRTSMAQDRADRGALSDPETDLDNLSAEELAVLVEKGDESLFAVGFYLTLRAPTEDALNRLERDVREALKPVGVVGNRWMHAPGFRSAGILPSTDKIGVRRTVDTTSLALSLPFLSAGVGTQGGPWLCAHHADRSPCLIDLYSRSEGWNAPMVCIVSPPGGGKTVTIACWACRHLTLPEPVDVILVDPRKGDYRRLVRRLGGQIVRISTTPDLVINPLDLPGAVMQSGTGEESGQNPVWEQTRLVTGLIALMVSDLGRLSKLQRAVIEQCVLGAYSTKGITSTDSSTWTAGPESVPTLADVLAELENHTEGHEIAVTMRPYVTGTLSKLFTGRTTLKLDSHLTSFDLEGMDNELRPLAIWVIGDYVWKLAKRDRKRRILSMDEVKDLLEVPESARLVAHLYTLGRAYNLSVWSATQLLSDYSSSPEGERALQSADTVLLLRQASGKGVQDAVERFALSPADGAFLASAPEGNGILKTPRGSARVFVSPSPLELSLVVGVPGVPAAEAAVLQ